MGLFKASSIDKKYTVDKKELGSGNFAVVKKGTVKKGVKDAPTGLEEGSEVAVKIIDKAKVNSLATVVHGCFSHPAQTHSPRAPACAGRGHERHHARD